MRSAASASMVAVSRLAPVGSLENAPSRTRATPGMGEQRNLPPLRATRAFAARLVDATGREFVDMSMGGGCHLFGHRPAFLQQALEAQLDRGMHLGPVGEQTHLVAEAFCALTRMERATFANSYAEALMTALRLCRASTGRSRVIVVRGAAAAHLLALENRAHGVAWDHGSDSELVDGPSGALQALRWRQDVAAIVLDGAALTADEPDLMALRDLAARERACLVVDERTTLFRVTLGGVNQALGLNADLVVHSGALSDGLPCAVLAGRASILDHVDGGWAGTPGGESLGVPTTYTAGTYCRNPLSMAASLAVLQAVVAQGEAGSRQLMNRTLELLGEMNSSFARAGVAVRARLHGGGIRLVSMDGGGQVFSLVQSLRSRGVHWDLTSAFLSSTHTDSDLNLVADAVDVAAQELASSRYLSSRGAQGLAVVNAR